MKLLAIILNYKTADMTLESLAALMRELAPFPDARVTIVDNDSRDGSFEKLREAVARSPWSDRVEVVASDYNGGFAYGNNFALRRALAAGEQPDYFYLLNSDAFPDPGCVKALVDFLDGHPDAGIAGSYVHGPEPEPHKTAFRFPSLASELESTLGLGIVSRLLEPWIVALPLPTATRQVDWLAGASMLIRRRVVETIGLMDETYFLYFEETDYCLQARRAGFTTHYVVESSVTHIGSVSTGYKDKSRPTPTYWYFSRRHYFLKNHGRLALWIANLLYVVGGGLCRLRARLLGRRSKDPERHLRDFIRFNFRLGAFPDGRPTPHRPARA
jgi:N-acetylglucosaminyl-diphospho-decaprenol L-rhamnosyltransferase